MWKEFNPNPQDKKTGDCAVRALCAAEGLNWYEVYDELYQIGREHADMENNNGVIAEFLRDRGYTRHIIPNTCPDCYTIRDFCRDNPNGIYVVGTGTHVVAVLDGNYYDAWDSGNEVPIYYWRANL